jgi:uncharacterized protein (DUF849 family)
MDQTVLLKVCSNGTREPGSHPALPLMPDQLGPDAAAAVAAGAAAVHVHPRGPDGRQTLEAGPCGHAVASVKAACPGIPVGVTTGAWIEPDPGRRLTLVEHWQILPDFASVNLGEPGAVRLAGLLSDRGIGLELGLWNPDDAHLLVRSGLAARSLRVMLEPQQDDPAAALANADATARVLDSAGVRARLLLHGMEGATWPVLEAALDRGLDTRVGLEDTLRLPDGSLAPDNAALVAEARRLAEARGLTLARAPVA